MCIEQKKALYRAIKTAGSMRKLGLLVGASTAAIAMWRSRGIIPPQYVLKIEKATGVSRHLLRPDIYPLDG
jgi:DNA-binding transcriptional regulator YdaS (Cro superfamily)